MLQLNHSRNYKLAGHQGLEPCTRGLESRMLPVTPVTRMFTGGLILTDDIHPLAVYGLYPERAFQIGLIIW